MPGKRNDAEGNTADREMALTRITSALVIILSILFWAATPSPGNRSIRFSIRGSLGGDIVCVGSEGECAEDMEIVRTAQAMPQQFNAPHTMVWKAWTNPKQVSLRRGPTGLTTTQLGYKLSGSERGVPAEQVEMMASFAKEGKTRLAMRMIFVSAEARDQNVRE